MLKKIGSMIGSVKRYVSNIQNEVTNLESETLDTSDNKKKDKNKEDI